MESNTTQQIPITEWEFTIGTTEGTDMIGTNKNKLKGVSNFLHQYCTCAGLIAKGVNVGLRTLQGIYLCRTDCISAVPAQDLANLVGLVCS